MLVVLNHILSTLSVTSSFCWDCNDRILTAYLSIAGARVFNDRVFGGLTTALCQFDLKVMIVSSVSTMPSESREISSSCFGSVDSLRYISLAQFSTEFDSSNAAGRSGMDIGR